MLWNSSIPILAVPAVDRARDMHAPVSCDKYQYNLYIATPIEGPHEKHTPVCSGAHRTLRVLVTRLAAHFHGLHFDMRYREVLLACVLFALQMFQT